MAHQAVKESSRRPKVAIVIGSLERGGVERQVTEFVRSAHPRHAECVVICLTHAGAFAAEVRAAGVRVLSLGFTRLSALRGVARLVAVLRRERPDAVVAHLFFGYALALPLVRVAAPTAARLAAVGSLPDYDIPPDRHLLPLRDVGLRSAHAVIANSRAVARRWEDAHPRLTGRVHVVPYGVRRSRPGRGERDGSAPTLICVANLIAYKGHRVLLDALDDLRGARYEFVALLVGDGPERENLELMVRQRRLDGVVRLLGHRDDVDHLLESADVLVLPSLTEGLPNAILEAMAHAVPVVATDVGAVRELLEGGAGVIVPAGDPHALAAALRRMLDDPSLRLRAGGLGLDIVRSNYSIEVMRDRTLAVIDEVRNPGRGA